jgi:uncharacterized membrane protein
MVGSLSVGPAWCEMIWYVIFNVRFELIELLTVVDGTNYFVELAQCNYD